MFHTYQVLLLLRNLRSIRQEIDEVKMQKRLIEKDLEDLTGIIGTIEDYINYPDKLYDKLEVQRTRIKEGLQKRKEIDTEIKAMHDQLEAKDAWFNYLVSWEISSWDNMFWNNLDMLLKVRRGELPAAAYIKPASESVGKMMVELYYKMVKDDTVSKWAHQKLKKENAPLQEQV